MHEPDYPSCMGEVAGFIGKHDHTPGGAGTSTNTPAVDESRGVY